MKFFMREEIQLFCIVFLLVCSSHFCGGVMAFVPMPVHSYISHRHNKPASHFLRQLVAKDATSTSISANNGTASGSQDSNSVGFSDAATSAKLPMRQQQILKVQNRLQEIQGRNSKGEKLTQEYCDSILGLCVAAEEWNSVLEVLDVMKDQGLDQQHSTYRSCLQSCFEMSNGAAAQEILDAMDKALVKPLPEDLGLVVAAMCRNNKQDKQWWKKALDLLLESQSPDIPVDAYNSVFACLVGERRWKEALRLLRDMERGPSTEDEARRHPEPTLSSYREVIECCVAANKVDQALQLILAMPALGITPTVYTFELVISALSKKLQWRRALQLLDLMDKLGVTKTVLTYNTIISACSRAKEVSMAKQLLTRMKSTGIKPSIITYNSLLSACASTNRFKDAMNVLDQLNRDPQCSPDIYTYTNAIRACAKAGKVDRALALYDVVKHKELCLDSYFYAAIIEACSRAKQWKRALGLLDEMKNVGVHPTVVIYSLCITACGNGRQWQKSLDLLAEMREQGMRINLITYNSAITALARAAKQPHQQNQAADTADDSELWIRALQLLDQMKADGVNPDGFSFASAISCCGASGKWEEAVSLLDIMRKGGPRTQPNKVAYTAAITACGNQGEHEQAMRLFRAMKEEGLSPDIVTYNAVFNSLKRSKQADTAYELWEEMCGGSTKSNNAAKATTTAARWTSPDIITLTDLIATLSSKEWKDDHSRVDEIFADAVTRGIFFSGFLDSTSEVDLSGMSFPVARAACRYTINRTLQRVEDSEKVLDLQFITGVGAAASKESRQRRSSPQGGKDFGKGKKSLSLRDYIQEVLREDFSPPIQSFVPKRAQGTIEIDRSVLQDWIKSRNK